MQTYERVLLKILPDRIDFPSICCFGAIPKFSTGYLSKSGRWVAVPIKHLLRDGFTFPYADPEWYEEGSIVINEEPCYFFKPKHVDILT